MFISWQTCEGFQLTVHFVIEVCKFPLQEGMEYVLTERFKGLKGANFSLISYVYCSKFIPCMYLTNIQVYRSMIFNSLTTRCVTCKCRLTSSCRFSPSWKYVCVCRLRGVLFIDSGVCYMSHDLVKPTRNIFSNTQRLWRCLLLHLPSGKKAFFFRRFVMLIALYVYVTNLSAFAISNDRQSIKRIHTLGPEGLDLSRDWPGRGNGNS